MLTYPHPAVKLLNATTPAVATYLHREGLSSVRAITDAAGVKVESALYKPFGEQSEWVLPGNAAPEISGGGVRLIVDAGEALAGGVAGGIRGIQGTSDGGTRVLASPNPDDGAKLLERLLGMASTGADIHGSQAELTRMGVHYVSVETFDNRLSARIAEVAANVGYVATHGTF
ncbi:MAG: hypothetical protein B7Z10_11680 [Rhodobacterales bacterium 32-66-7]|nr:MAG: hypothetical protein B7Z31_07030 [Rhodobacterales bacterium 12-65-15]OYX23230.1 MAG: hypothetical protein B7Z10_11680 [Rhodobacterales bacterium 32-66-7]